MVTKELISTLFNYYNGNLYWKVCKSNRATIGTMAGYQNKQGYKFIRINKKVYPLHKLVFCLFNGYMPKEIDHIDINPFNNKIENLRECTKSQNQHNKKLQSNNTSGVKGVYWNKRLGKWMARIKLFSKYIYLGYFEDLEFAELVIYEARLKYHGQFAKA